jgi:hypothetical protein
MTATINTLTGIVIDGATYSVYGVFGETVATNVAATGEKRDFTRSEVADLITSGAATLVNVCQFCGSPDMQHIDLASCGSLDQCSACKSIRSDDIDGSIFDILFAEKGVPASDTVQSFDCNVRPKLGKAGSYTYRLRGMARGGVIFQWS